MNEFLSTIRSDDIANKNKNEVRGSGNDRKGGLNDEFGARLLRNPHPKVPCWRLLGRRDNLGRESGTDSSNSAERSACICHRNTPQGTMDRQRNQGGSRTRL